MFNILLKPLRRLATLHASSGVEAFCTGVCMRRRLRSAPFHKPSRRNVKVQASRRRHASIDVAPPSSSAPEMVGTTEFRDYTPLNAPIPPLFELPRKRHIRWRRIGLWSAPALILATGALVWGAALWRPSWYQPLRVDRARLKSDKAAFANLLGHISDELNAGRAVTVELTQDQVNRWIAARHELFLDEDVELLDQIPGAFVSFLDGQRVRVAGQGRWKGWDCVLSAVVRLEANADAVDARCVSLAAGTVPIPPSWAPETERAIRIHDRTAQRDGLHVRAENDWVWFNGKRPFRFRDVQTEPGVLRVTLEPTVRLTVRP
jgi:hypothetical protein